MPRAHLPPLAALTGPTYYLLAVAPYGWSLEGSPDANIGAGLAIFLTIAFALPWSLLLFPSADIDGWGGNATEAAYTALALVNVALHAALMYGLYRRALRRHDAAVEPAP